MSHLRLTSLSCKAAMHCNISERIYNIRADMYFIMQMRPCRNSGTSDIADYFTLLNALANP